MIKIMDPVLSSQKLQGYNWSSDSVNLNCYKQNRDTQINYGSPGEVQSST